MSDRRSHDSNGSPEQERTDDELSDSFHVSTSSDLFAGRMPVPGSQGAEQTTNTTFDPNRSASQSTTPHRRAAPSLANTSAPVRATRQSSAENSVGLSDVASAPLPKLAQMIRDTTLTLLFPAEPDADTQLSPTRFGGDDRPPLSARPANQDGSGARTPTDANYQTAEDLQPIDYGACYLGDAYEAFVADIRFNYMHGAPGSSEPQPHNAAASESTAGTRNVSTRPGTSSSGTGATSSSGDNGPWWQEVPNFAPEVILNDENRRANFMNYLRNVQLRSAPSGRPEPGDDSISEDRRTV